MRTIKRILIWTVLILAAAAGLIMWQRSAATEDEFSYRVEATFDENGTPIVGSNVVHVAIRRNIPCIDMCGYTFVVQGQAIPIRFSNGKYVFVLLGVAEQSVRAGNMPFQAFRALPPHRKISELPRARVPVPPRYMPTMIYFTDMADPQSALLVNEDNIATLVGANVRLMNVSVELTDDPVSTGIDRLLPWIGGQEVVEKLNGKTSTSHRLYPETDSNSKTLQSDYPRFLERNDW